MLFPHGQRYHSLQLFTGQTSSNWPHRARVVVSGTDNQLIAPQLRGVGQEGVKSTAVRRGLINQQPLEPHTILYISVCEPAMLKKPQIMSQQSTQIDNAIVVPGKSPVNQLH